ncbi:DUF6781 family protein [Piscinibacter sp. XHJ-5]|uniref:DUF6781 family protein n=1 Tax=Piscinibacter sp. XHJ-5 TaxID=3037797 RepID=UPI00245370B9|nr:DUF6781 family protein [Piscinibacter sp. XHJ-5]
MKAGIDQDALIEMFASASAKQGEQLRDAVRQATLGALQGRELSLKNIKDVLSAVTKAATTGAAQSSLPAVDVENLLNSAVAGMDDALLKAVDANRVALQQFVEQGVDLQEKQLKKAVADLEKFEDTLIGVVKKSAEAASAQLGAPWSQVLEKLQAGGTLSGAQAASTAEQLADQMQSAVRNSRAAGLKAAQALAQSYSALVSGVLIGMSEALQQGSASPAAKTRKR